MLKVQVIGNLGADAEVRNQEGKQFVTFKVAHTESYEKADGTKVENTQWVSCVLSGDGGNLLQYLKKGVKVFVSGRLSARVFSSAKMRCMVAGLDCSVDTIELCGGSSESVPRQLVDPNSGALLPITKLYWLQQHDGITQLIGERGGAYNVDPNGFVTIAVEPSQQEEQNAAPQGQQEDAKTTKNS